MFDLRGRGSVDVHDLIELQRHEADANRASVAVFLTHEQHVRVWRQLASYPYGVITPDGDVRWPGMTLRCENGDTE